MGNVGFGDIVFIIGVFGIIYTCLRLARSATKTTRKPDSTGKD